MVFNEFEFELELESEFELEFELKVRSSMKNRLVEQQRELVLNFELELVPKIELV